MKAGAIDFLAKPFRDQDLLDAVTAALEITVKMHRGSASKKMGAKTAAVLSPMATLLWLNDQ